MAKTRRRKLLTGAVGVATVSYVIACGGMGGGETSGNLVAAGGSVPVPEQGGSGGTGGSSGGSGTSGAGGYGGAETSGNLVAAGGTAPEQGGTGGVPSARDAGASDAAAEPADAAVDSGP